MEVNTYYGRCVCCFTYGYLKNMWTEHIWEGKKEIYAEMLVQCFGLSWDSSENAINRDKICETCITKLREANEFKNTVLYSQTRLDCIDEDNSQADFDDGNDEDLDNTKVDYEEIEFLDDEDIKDCLESYDTPELKPCPTSDNERTTKSVSKKHEKYTKKDLQECVQAVLNGEITLKDASVKYNIPRSTINAKRKSMRLTVEKYPKNLILHNNGEIPKKAVLRCDRAMYRQYTDEDLDACLTALNNKEMTIQSASEKYNIPKSTITSIRRLGFRDVQSTEDQSKKKKRSVNKRRGYEFKVRANVRNILQYSNATPFRAYCGSAYACAYCSYKNTSPAELKSHTLQSHVGNLEAFNIRSGFLDMMIKLDITGLKCVICCENFSFLDIFLLHLKHTHDINLHLNVKEKNIVPFKFDTEELRCAICEKPFELFKFLTEHMTEHFRNFECDICGRGFIYQKRLMIHNSTHQIGDFKCSYCDKVFKTKITMKAHERVLHKKASKTRKCSYCDEMFMDVAQKSKHEMIVHGAELPSYECKACNKQFFSTLALKTHTKRFHLLFRPHKCDICGKGFYYKYGLKKHEVKHTGVKNFQCDICHKWYSSRSSIISHMRIHLGDRRYKCDICEQTFVQKCSWSMHLRNKHGINH